MKKHRFTALAAAFVLLTGCGGQSAPEETAAKSADITASATETETSVSETEAVTQTEALPEPEKPLFREKKGVIKGGGEDIFTIMLYMCGTDLESDMGAATDDIIEMCAAEGYDKVNLLLYTGGTKEWQNDFISCETNQIWQVVHDTIHCVEEDMGSKSMTDPATLEEFIRYVEKNFPADRRALILWDHGGGAVFGYGTDEISGGDPMSISDLASAIDRAGVYFDFIGFDACLMANVETAYAISEYADYMIASEELEPGGGWYYTDWLDALSRNTSMSTEEIGRNIVDSFIDVSAQDRPGEEFTLSVTDLTKMDNVIGCLNRFSAGAAERLDGSDFAEVSRSRRDSKAFGGEDYDIIDLSDFAKNLGVDGSEELIAAVNDAVVYSAHSDNISGCCGLSLYLPFKNIEMLERMLPVYSNIGIEGEYTAFAGKFATLVAGGQSGGGGMANPFGNTGEWNGDYVFDDWAAYEWFDEDYAAEYSDSYSDSITSASALEVEDRGDHFALAISQDEWDILSDIKMQIFYNDGEGYIDLGTDNYFETDYDGALMVDFDGLWFTINDIITPFRVSEVFDGGTKGLIHCLLNGEEVDLVVLWDNDNRGAVIGAQRYYSSGVSGKGLIPVNDGDRIQLLCDYYTYDGDYEDNYFYGDEFIFDSSMNVYYSPSGEGEYLLYYAMTDLYNNVYYTEAVILDFDEEFFMENYPEYYE